jgi:hypothetical protein
VTLALISAAIAFCFLSLALWFDAHDRGYNLGREQGYQEGFADGLAAGQIRADEWWTDVEVEVKKAREEIWKEGS